jgi:SAM-dependent methyltransferase
MPGRDGAVPAENTRMVADDRPARADRPALASRLSSALALVRIRELALAAERCPFCGPSLALRLRADEIGVRCLRCGATPVHAALGRALHRHIANLPECEVCELSARGPLVRYLLRHARRVSLSEYVPEATAGGGRGPGVRHEDVQHLSYADASFDLVTHTEVLEHVPDDRRALAELRRVLRPGGLMLFTVPLHGGAATIERARLRDGMVEHLLAPVYHGDPLRGGAPVLAFRDYAGDIVARLRDAGFEQAWIEPGRGAAAPFGIDRPVVCARR